MIKKVIALILVSIFFINVCIFPKYAYADWASPIVKTTTKNFTYNGLQYTVKITDTITSAKATKIGQAVLTNPNISKVAIPLRFLGWVGAAASIGYLVYDISQVKPAIQQAFPMPQPTPDDYIVCVIGWFDGPFSDRPTYANVAYNGSFTIQQGGSGDARRYRVVGFRPSDGGQYASALVYASSASEIRVNGNFNILSDSYFPDVCNTASCEIQKCSQGYTRVSPPVPSEQQIRDWVNANRSPFESMNPTLTQSKPTDAVELTTDYPDISAQIQSSPDQPDESQPAPEQKQLPSPEEGSYVDPDVPVVPAFDTTFDVPEKKNIADLVERWLMNIPWISAFRDIGISASGECSFSVTTPFGSVGEMNFCQYSSVFSVIGGFIFVFACIYSIYIIFKRSD